MFSCDNQKYKFFNDRWSGECEIFPEGKPIRQLVDSSGVRLYVK
jgi:hypothetical protein